jgi:hypothetical protein
LFGKLKEEKKSKFLVTKFEFGGSFGMSLEGDCHEAKVPPNLEIVGHFWCELGGSWS